MRNAILDIETTGLGAVGSGILLCVCIRPTDTHRTRTFRLDHYPQAKTKADEGSIKKQEGYLLQDIIQEIEKYSILIGHHIAKYDVPFIKSRCFQQQISMRPVTLYDTLIAFRKTNYLTIPNGFGKPAAGLDMVADFLGVTQDKTRILPNDWWTTIWDTKSKQAEAMDKIQDHCEKDVRMNDKILPYLWDADPRPKLQKVF